MRATIFRYMFFLARCGHAPAFCGRLFQRLRTSPEEPAADGVELLERGQSPNLPRPRNVSLSGDEGSVPSVTTQQSTRTGPNTYVGGEISEVYPGSDADSEQHRTPRRDPASSQDLPSPPLMESLAVPPRTHRAPNRNRTIRPRDISTSSTVRQSSETDDTDFNSDLSLSQYESNSSDPDSGIAGTKEPRIKRQKYYDKSKTVPWVVSFWFIPSVIYRR